MQRFGHLHNCANRLVGIDWVGTSVTHGSTWHRFAFPSRESDPQFGTKPTPSRIEPIEKNNINRTTSTHITVGNYSNYIRMHCSESELDIGDIGDTDRRNTNEETKRVTILWAQGKRGSLRGHLHILHQSTQPVATSTSIVSSVPMHCIVCEFEFELTRAPFIGHPSCRNGHRPISP